MTGLLVAIAAIVGGVGGYLLGRKSVSWPSHGRPEAAYPVDVNHSIDLLRRAHGLDLVCIVADDGETILSKEDSSASPAVVDRAVSTAKLAMADGRSHTVRDPGLVAAIGDGVLGAAICSSDTTMSEDDIDSALSDLRRIAAGVRVHHLHASARLARSNDRPSRSAMRDSVEGLATDLAFTARALTNHGAAVAVVDPATRAIHIESVSQGVDRRLVGSTVTVGSAVGRAALSDNAIVGRTAAELFGTELENRRKSDSRGVAFPLRDGREGVGALVVFGSVEDIQPALREQLAVLAGEAGARISSAVAIRAAERRAMTDELTGLPNRRALDAAMSVVGEDLSGSLLLIDIDHFKKVNDTHGHAAGDDALKHVARTLAQSLRDSDLAARIGGEEFALWLPQTPIERAAEVAERSRSLIENSEWIWSGQRVPITCSVGVAAVPTSTVSRDNLYMTADAALYRAKENGRNRVEVAPRRPSIEQQRPIT